MLQENGKPNITDMPMTPEEKLFRIIANAAQDEDDYLKSHTPPEGWNEKSFNEAKKNIRKLMKNLNSRSDKLNTPLRSALERFRMTQSARAKWITLLFSAALLFLALFFILRSVTAQRQTSNPGLEGSRTLALELENGKKNSSSYFLWPGILGKSLISGGVSSPGTQAASFKYKLVGISWDKDEYVAMMENGVDKGARFVRQGDLLPGGIKVDQIKEYSVLVSREGKQWELA